VIAKGNGSQLFCLNFV